MALKSTYSHTGLNVIINMVSEAIRELETLFVRCHRTHVQQCNSSPQAHLKMLSMPSHSTLPAVQ